MNQEAIQFLGSIDGKMIQTVVVRRGIGRLSNVNVFGIVLNDQSEAEQWQELSEQTL